MIRQPAVAGQFYPGRRSNLDQTISELFPSPLPATRPGAIAAISPHAGYIYSGGVAAETLGSIEIPKTVLILGLNHHGRGARIALSRSPWDVVTGQVPVNEQIADNLLSQDSPIEIDEEAHRYEHSVEVQVPILLALQPELSIVPLILSHLTYEECVELAGVITPVIKNSDEEILIVASSDMSHYESRSSASAKDKLALDQIAELDPHGLYSTVHKHRISMCGVIPVTVALLVAQQLGASESQLIRYTDSGEVSGDTDQVVGYAGVVVR